MATQEMSELQRIFLTRLDTLDRLLDIGEQHIPNLAEALQTRLAPDMLPLGAQIALACNPPRGFSQWCAGLPIENLSLNIDSLELARACIQQTKTLVSGIDAEDSKLDESKRIGLGPDKYCVLPARQYLNDYVLPNLYFHLTAAYAILRTLGVPLGKADYLTYLGPHVKSVSEEQ